MEDAAEYFGLLCISFLVFYLLKKKNTGELKGRPLPGPSLNEGIVTFVKGSKRNNLHHYLPQWAQKYGDIMQLNLLIRKVVFVNDANTFRALVRHADFRDLTNDRPETFVGKYFMFDCKGLILATNFGSILQQKRKLFHNILKFYGEGKGEFEAHVVRSLEIKTQKLMTKKTVKLSIFLKNYIRSLIGYLLDGDFSAESRDKLETIREYVAVGEKLFIFENETLLQSFPFLRFVPGLRFKHLYLTCMAAKDNFYKAYFTPQKLSLPSGETRGMVNELLEKQQECKENGSELQLDDDAVRALMGDVISAGYLTTSSTLSSLFLHLIKYENIQDQVYDEITRVIGNSTPSIKHRSQMPFTEAVILETLRISSNLPLLLPHLTRQDIIFDGYFIPKSSILLMNAWHCHHREDYWEDPFTFKPERFLDPEGNLVDIDHPARQRLINFGAGRRGCPGETFGKSRIFLITTILLQKFQFLADPNEALPSLDPKDWVGVTALCPDDYTCRIKVRSVA